MKIGVNWRTNDRERDGVRFTVLDLLTEDFDPFARATLVMDVDDKVVENNLGLLS